MGTNFIIDDITLGLGLNASGGISIILVTLKNELVKSANLVGFYSLTASANFLPTIKIALSKLQRNNFSINGSVI